MHVHKSRNRNRPFGLTLATLRFLQQAGYIASQSASDYTFQEFILLRTVSALHAAKVPTRTIRRALRELRPWIDETHPMWRVGFDVAAGGIRVRDGRLFWEPGSGQYALPLEGVAREANVVPLVSEKFMKKKHTAAHAHYLRGSALEEDDVEAAREAYESCLAGDCRHLEARINLGRLLHLAGLLREAEAMYTGQEDPSSILYFNLGVLLEDLNRDLDAIAAYRKAIVHDPGMADAHFNLSLVHERLGEAQAAFRHLLAYRRLIEAHKSVAG
ncbi:MAG: hypothetical protein M3N50_03200 [Pseudomonadota bacterium]|nr:hypothetical protein [Pseudomonadota bacterium]